MDDKLNEILRILRVEEKTNEAECINNPTPYWQGMFSASRSLRKRIQNIIEGE